MASILQFRPVEGTKQDASMAIDVPRGEVVIFPGVRIERREAVDPVPTDRDRKPVRAREK